MSSEIKANSISEVTSANGVTIDGLNIKDSAINTGSIGSNVVFPSDKVVKAWVKFSGGTQDIEDDYGISSRVDSSLGNVLMNFDTAMSNTNYVIVASYGKNNDAYARVTRPGATQSTTQFNLISVYTTSGGEALVDPDAGHAIVFGDS